jgi:hypothetical protein
VDLATGKRRLEVELKKVQGEAEGLHITSLLGGTLLFLVAPLAAKPTFGPSVGLLHFTPGSRRGLRVSASATRRGTPRPRVRVRVTRRGNPVEGARVAIAGARMRTNSRGVATLWPALSVPGHFAAVARKSRSSLRCFSVDATGPSCSGEACAGGRGGVRTTHAGSGWHATTDIRFGIPLDTLLHAAANQKADALVVGARTTRRLERALLGSVAAGALNHSRIPVLVVP